MRSTSIAGVALCLGLLSVAARAADFPLFLTSERCIACHSSLQTPQGNDVSIGYQWRASMMANSARDPYWQAGVRREVMDYPQAQAAIEDKCATCHMPMARTQAVHGGDMGQVLAHLGRPQNEAPLAFDGVSCPLCHQITAQGLGTVASFSGGYAIDGKTVSDRAVYGPFDVDAGRHRIMQSSSGFQPTMSTHVQQSEFCATCHTLYTESPDGRGEKFPEQMPYFEWLASDYRNSDSCQSCHMPAAGEPTAITAILGQPRELRTHGFVGGNAYMIRVLDRYREQLGVKATSGELAAGAQATQVFLRTRTAQLAIEAPRRGDGALMFAVDVRNLSGHKLPTAYPSRRAWLHVTVRDQAGRVVFESGAMNADGSVAGNDNDADALRFEPHYAEISDAGQVQIYESVMVDRNGRPTTGLLSAARYVKDNRLLPRGFVKAQAGADIAVHGAAADDADFNGGGDQVRYRVAVPASAGRVTVSAELLFQIVGFRWARNLDNYDAAEPRRFTQMYRETAGNSAEQLASAQLSVP